MWPFFAWAPTMQHRFAGPLKFFLDSRGAFATRGMLTKIGKRKISLHR